MKNLANCKPSEFLAQTYKMKSRVEKFCKEIDIAKIRAELPQLEPVPENASDDEVDAITRRNVLKMRNKAMQNASKILDAALSTNVEDTLALLAMACFIDPNDADNHPMSDYLNAFAEILSDAAVVRFFTSLAQLNAKNTQPVSEK